MKSERPLKSRRPATGMYHLRAARKQLRCEKAIEDANKYFIWRVFEEGTRRKQEGGSMSLIIDC
jgi:hypothetical protein